MGNETSNDEIPPHIQPNETFNFEIIAKHNKENIDAKLIEDIISHHFYFSNIEKQAKTEIIKQISLIFIHKDKQLVSSNTQPYYFYIIKEGFIELSIHNSNKKHQYKRGDYFGDIELIFNKQYNYSAKSITDCYLWCIDYKSFNVIVSHMQHVNYETKSIFLNTFPMFMDMHYNEHKTLLKNTMLFTYYDNRKIIKKGEKIKGIYFILQGQIHILKGWRKTQYVKIGKGDFFGEKEIIGGEEYYQWDMVISNPKTQVLFLPLSKIISMLGHNYKDKILLYIMKYIFISSHSFNSFNLGVIKQIFKLFTIKRVNSTKDNRLYQSAGYIPSKKLVLVLNGALYNSSNKDVLANKCQILFDSIILEENPKPIDYNIISSDDNETILLEASTAELEKHFKYPLKEFLLRNKAMERIKQIELFKHFTRKKLEAILEKIKIAVVKNGQNIITQGEEGNKFFIIKSGTIDIYINNKYIRTLSTNCYFGERALFYKEPRSATAIANGDVEVFYIEKDDFGSTIDSNLREYLQSKLFLQDNTIKLNELIFCDLLGSGSYGHVALVKSRKTNIQYAIKNIPNKQILYEQIHHNLELERNILLQIDHPFIVKLVKTLKDKKHVYFLMEYINGKELFDVIRDIGLLSKEQTQFFSASLMLTMEYLHKKKFIFRDIKPENIMILKNGYIKLIDFGTATKIEDKTTTIIGTPHYMAPEVILGDGYSFQVDFWSIGICMYEFMCGTVPFGETAEDPLDVYLAVINDKLKFPNFIKDRDFKGLVQLMLEKKYVDRYCTFSQIKNHVWFAEFNWDELESMEMKACYIPNLNVNNKEKFRFVEYIDFVNVSCLIYI